MKRRVLRPLFALIVVWQLMPGTGELLENVAHLVREGHLAHARPGADHQATNPEHGCSGPYHFCSCHTASSFILSAGVVSLAPLAPEAKHAEIQPSAIRSGHAEQLFRPPIAA